MADHGLFIGFGFPARGREAASLKVFQELLEFLAAQQAQGAIDGFEPVLIQPHGGDLGGFVLVRGERSALDAMAAGDPFQRILTRGQATVESLGVTPCVMGAELQRRMGTFQEQISDLI